MAKQIKLLDHLELFGSFFNRFKIELKTLIRGHDFIFDCVHLLYYKCHKIKYKRGGSYKDSLFPEWIQKKQQ